MIIYLNKGDMRSYALTPNVDWEAIEVEVSDDFVGGGKRYDLDTQTWIDDVVEPLTQQEIDYIEKQQIIYELETEKNKRSTSMMKNSLLGKTEEAKADAKRLDAIDFEIESLKR